MNNKEFMENYHTVKIPKRFYAGLVKIFYDLGIDGKEYVDEFIHSYIEYAYHQSSKKADIYLTTGFGRTYVNNYLKGVISQPKSKYYYRSLIGRLKDLSDKLDSGEIPILGKYNSFNAVFNQTKPPSKLISGLSMLNKLIQAGHVKKTDSKHIKFLTTLPTNGLNDPDSIIHLLSSNMNRLCYTLLHNKSTINNEDTLLQSSYFSNCILPKYHESCLHELREEARKCMKNCKEIIDSYEEKGISKKMAESNNHEIGISAFIFNNPK